MCNSTTWLLSAAVGALLSSPAVAVGQETRGKPATEVVLSGEVRPLAEVLAARGIHADPVSTDRQVVLCSQDGTIIYLLSNEASRALFLDTRLHARPVEIKGLRHPGLPSVEVVLFRVEEEGERRVPEYWCEVCSISVRYPQPCPCCQGELELRFKQKKQD